MRYGGFPLERVGEEVVRPVPAGQLVEAAGDGPERVLPIRLILRTQQPEVIGPFV